MVNNQYTVNDILHDTKLQEQCAEHYVSPYPSISLTVDACIFITDNSENYYKDNPALWNILLITRKNEPWKNHLALPGGFVNYNEEVIKAVRRELFEETGLAIPEQKFNFSGYYDKVDRDPRGRVMSLSFSAYLCLEKLPNVKGNDDASNADFYNLNDVLSNKYELASDHLFMINNSWKSFLYD